MSETRLEDRAFEAWKEYDRIADHDNMTKYQYFLEGWRGGEAASQPGPDVSRLLAAAKEAFALMRELERDEQSWDPDGDRARRLHGISLRLEAALAEHESAAQSTREEQCTRCREFVAEWVDPDWAKGRICLACESAAGQGAARPAQPSNIDTL